MKQRRRPSFSFRISSTLLLSFLLLVVVTSNALLDTNYAFVNPQKHQSRIQQEQRRKQQQQWPLQSKLDSSADSGECIGIPTVDRKEFVSTLTVSLMTAAASTSPMLVSPTAAHAAEVEGVAATTTAPVAVEMKLFVDPKGLFVLNIPKRFFTLRRSAKGDLPDEKTGQGRRGSSIFTAGDMAKSEIIAVERFPTRVLLEENGIEATGNLQTIPDLGNAEAIAKLIALRRDKDKPGNTLASTKLIPNSLTISPDKKELSFTLRTEIEVQKPELLLEQSGVSELFRITTAKASLTSNDGNMLAVFASCLETDWKGPDGSALAEAVQSFQATDQSGSTTISSS